MRIIRFYSSTIKIHLIAGKQDKSIALNMMLNLVRDQQNKKALQMNDSLPRMFEYILKHDGKDKYLVSEMLILPSEKYIGEQMEIS